MLVREIMRSEVPCIHPHASLREAAERMARHGLQGLLVMDEGQLVGMLGIRDLFTAPRTALDGTRMDEHQTEASLVERWRRQRVATLMNTQVLAVTERTPLIQAAALMANSGKHPLPVVRDGQVIGVIDRADVVRALLALNGS